MWEMVTRKRVWEGQLMQVADKVEKGERPPLPENHPLSDLIDKCWAHGNYLISKNYQNYRF